MAFEFKKILSNKIIVVFFVFIVVAVFVYFSNSVGTFGAKGTFFPDDQESIQRAMEYIEKYDKQSESVINTARRIKAESSDEYTKRLSDKIISQRENRRALPLGDNSAVIWYGLVQRDTYISLLPVFLCILISAELFCGERRTGVFKLNSTSKNGRFVLYKNKIITLLICSACAAIIYTAIQLIAIVPVYGVTSANVPIQVDSAYANCAYNIGFLQFALAVTGMRILSCWFACALTVCLALIFGSLIASVAVSGVTCTILLLMYERTLTLYGATDVLASKYYLHHNLLKFSPIGLLSPNGYFVSSDYVNVLDFPVTELFFNIIVTTLITAALMVLGAYLFSRKRRRIT